MHIYRLCLDDYVSFEVYYLGSDQIYTEEEFTALCNSLVPDATKAVLATGEPTAYNFITWRKIVEELKNHLLAYGFKEVKLPAAWYRDSWMGYVDEDQDKLLGDLKDEITRWNTIAGEKTLEEYGGV